MCAQNDLKITVKLFDCYNGMWRMAIHRNLISIDMHFTRIQLLQMNNVNVFSTTLTMSWHTAQDRTWACSFDSYFVAIGIKKSTDSWLSIWRVHCCLLLLQSIYIDSVSLEQAKERRIEHFTTIALFGLVLYNVCACLVFLSLFFLCIFFCIWWMAHFTCGMCIHT